MPAVRSAVYAFSPFAIPVALTAVVVFVFGVWAFVRRVTAASVALLGLTSVIALWLVPSAMTYSTIDAAVALRWSRAAYLGVPFIAPALYWFTIEILRIEKRRRHAHVAGWSLATLFSAIAITTDRLIPSVEHQWFGFYPRHGGGIALAFLAFFSGYVVASLVELFRADRAAQGSEKKRIRLVLIAVGLASLAFVDCLPMYGIAIYPLGWAAILGFIAAVGVAIRRYALIALAPSLAAQEIIDTMADAVFVCDGEGTIEFVNRAAASLLGYAESELAGRRINDLLVTPDRDLMGRLHRRSFRNHEYVFTTKTGERVELTLSIAPVVQDGTTAGAVIIGRDMRDRKRAEREVLQAVTLLQSTLESTADGILVIGSGGRIVSYNQRFVDMWRVPQTVMDSGDDHGVLRCVVDQISVPANSFDTFESVAALPEGQSFDLLKLKDGRRFERYLIERHVEEETIRVWSFRDVTARFTAEAALRESEIRYRLLFEQNAAGVCVSRLDGEIVDCNATFASMLGFRRAELLGRRMSEFYAKPAESDELTSLLRRVGTMNSVEIELRRSDRHPLWVIENLVLVGDPISGMVHATVVDISDRKRAEEQIEFHAYHDVLTHLPNRRLFTDRLDHALARAKRSGKSVAVMFIDVDHFKTINDTLGHTAGDELLLAMSRRLRECVRDDDTVARLGGDEFTIILADLRQPEHAMTVAQKILEAVQQPLAIAQTPIVVTASIGIAIYPVDGTEPESLLRNADSAMYRAKQSGRNTYQLCTDEMKRRAMERFSIENRLRTAVHDHQLVLAYQPLINVVTGRTIGVEALVRWDDPERGVVEPASFISIAEETRLILPLGEWVLRTACKQTKQWQEGGAGPIRVGVNLSARQFAQRDLLQMVTSALDESGLSASSLELEISETTAMQNAEISVEVLRALRKIGVGISIDDFGMGYSSLNHLRRFPITAVKIDRAFVNDLMASGEDAAIVSAVISMARSLRLRVVAEGVETAEQLAFLRSKECDEAQGYYFSRPMLTEDVTRILLDCRILAAEKSM